MLFRKDADVDYRLTASKGIYSILRALRKNYDIQEVWLVQKGGSLTKSYQSGVLTYNIYNFGDGKEIVQKLEPDLLLLSGDYEYLTRSLLRAGTALGIPVVILVSAFPFWVEQNAELRMVSGRIRTLYSRGGNILYRYCFLLKTLSRCGYGISYLLRTLARDIYIPLTSYEPTYKFGGGDLNLASSTEWIEILVKNGIDRSRIILVGDWGMDLIYERMKVTVAPSEAGTRILFITTAMVEHGYWNSEMRETVVKGIIGALKKINIKSLKVKIHPASENIEDYKKIILPIDPNIEIVQREELLPLLSESDIVITFGESWALFEALLLSKPILVVNLFHEDTSRNPFIKEGVAMECRSIEELVLHVDTGQIFKPDPEKVSTFIEKSVYKFDGKCGERAAAQIMSFLERRKQA